MKDFRFKLKTVFCHKKAALQKLDFRSKFFGGGTECSRIDNDLFYLFLNNNTT